MGWVQPSTGWRQGNVALNVAALLLDSVTRARHTCRRFDEFCCMRFIVGARGLHELGDKGTPPGRHGGSWVYNTYREPADVRI